MVGHKGKEDSLSLGLGWIHELNVKLYSCITAGVIFRAAEGV